VPLATEVALASVAALLAGYVREKANPRPFSLAALGVRCAEAVVCGFLAAGIAVAIAAYFRVSDPRMTVAISSALGLIGTGVISDLVVRWIAARASKP
jgi:hypothetical protein